MQSNPKCIKRSVLGEEKTERQYVRGNHVYRIIWKTWKQLVGECLQCVKDPASEVEKNDVLMVHTNSHYKGEVVGHVQQKSPWLHPYLYSCPLHFEHLFKWKISQSCRWIQTANSIKFYFYRPEKTIKLAKSKIKNIEENLDETDHVSDLCQKTLAERLMHCLELHHTWAFRNVIFWWILFSNHSATTAL